MPGKFQLKKARNGKVYFNLLAANGEVILTSQMYTTKKNAKGGIASVQANAGDKSCYEAKKNKAGKHFFVLKAKNHQVIATSESYAGSTGMKKAMTSAGKNGKSSKIEDLAK